MNITTNWVFGNFDITAGTNVEAESLDPKTLKLCSLGLLKALYGSPATAAEKYVVNDFGVEGLVKWPKNKKGEPERPKDFKRNSIPFSEENAVALAEGFGTSTTVDRVKIDFAITGIVENESDTIGSRKRATALVDALLSTEESKGQLIGTLTILGMPNAKTADREALITFAHSKGLGMK